MKAPPHTTFDALPDVAFIQIRHLLNYKVVPYSATTIWRLCRDGKFHQDHVGDHCLESW